MKQFPFKKIDAFATPSSSGNPAALVSLQAESDASPADMQRIARELKGFVSEVGFAWPLPDRSFRLRYFSSEREVEFCGHATIAILYDLILNDPLLLRRPTLSIQTNSATLEVENRIPSENAVYVASPSPRFRTASVPPATLAQALRSPHPSLVSSLPVSIVNAGLETLLVPMASPESVLSLAPSFDELKAFCLAQSVDILVAFSGDPSAPEPTFRTRVFAPTFGYLEDPATGSGNAALGHYLLANRLWDGRPMALRQNASRLHPNLVRIVAKPTAQDAPSVLFGGGAIVRIQGRYFLP